MIITADNENANKGTKRTTEKRPTTEKKKKSAIVVISDEEHEEVEGITPRRSSEEVT